MNAMLRLSAEVPGVKERRVMLSCHTSSLQWPEDPVATAVTGLPPKEEQHPPCDRAQVLLYTLRGEGPVTQWVRISERGVKGASGRWNHRPLCSVSSFEVIDMSE